ncbi:AIMP1 protein, partial [Mystacornis crossleyi]|nr:AIMP1 protein [Mystacornis crossleyi]
EVINFRLSCCLSRFLSRFLVKMAANNAVLNRLEQKGAEADQVIEYLKQQVALLKEKASILSKILISLCFFIYVGQLKNSVFKVLVLPLTSVVLILVKQVAVPPGTTLSTKASFSEDVPQPTAVTASSGSKDQIKGEDEEKKKKEKVEKKGTSLFLSVIDKKLMSVIRREVQECRECILNLRRREKATVILQKCCSTAIVVRGYIALTSMQNRMAVLLCNLKPAKMRGVVSQAMVMCASSPEKVEILAPPPGAVPGDRITFEGFPG